MGTRKGGPKFTDLEREMIKEKVALLDRKGYSQTAIAKQVGVAQSMVWNYLQQIKEEYRSRTVRHRHEMIAEKIEQYKDVRRVAWEAYEKSLSDGEKQVQELWPIDPTLSVSDSGDYNESMRRLKMVVTREGRIPANEYLSTILSTLKAECALLGLDEQPSGTNLNLEVNTGVQVNNQLTLKQVLEAAKDQMQVGTTPVIVHRESVNGSNGTQHKEE